MHLPSEYIEVDLSVIGQAVVSRGKEERRRENLRRGWGGERAGAPAEHLYSCQDSHHMAGCHH